MFHAEALDDAQLQLLRQLGPIMDRAGFYLAGGTAVALYFGHRKSLDLDWFTASPTPDLMPLAQQLRDAGVPFTASSVGPGTLHGDAAGIRVSAFEYRYPLLTPATHWEECGCSLAALDDLACMKLSAVAQRGSRKDFLDIYALLLRHRPLSEMLDLYRRKYAVADVGHVLIALSYFEDADREPSPLLLWQIDWKTVKRDVAARVKEAA